MSVQLKGNVYFARVQDGKVVQTGWTDRVGFIHMQEQSPEYVEITRTQYDALKLGDPFK